MNSERQTNTQSQGLTIPQKSHSDVPEPPNFIPFSNSTTKANPIFRSNSMPSSNIINKTEMVPIFRSNSLRINCNRKDIRKCSLNRGLLANRTINHIPKILPLPIFRPKQPEFTRFNQFYYDNKYKIRYIRLSNNSKIALSSVKKCSCINYVLGKKCPHERCRYAHVVLRTELGYEPIGWYEKLIRNDSGSIDIYYSRHQNGVYWFNFDKNLKLQKVYQINRNRPIYLDVQHFIKDVNGNIINPCECVD
jgi:hypothetical protein